MKKFLITAIAAASLSFPVWADDEESAMSDGAYDAYVKTDSGRYKVPVEVEDGEVTKVRWPNGGNMRVRGADLDSDGEAVGRNSDGDRIKIEIDK